MSLPYARLASLAKMMAFLLVLVAIVVVPFLLFGERMEADVPALLQASGSMWAIAVLAASLLALDVVLPIPSSIVSIGACILLGPLIGVAVVFIGMLGSFILGYALGHLLPANRLRDWVGPSLWDKVSTDCVGSNLMWIAASRPLPVLAEVMAIFAGTARLPFLPCVGIAGLSSLMIAGAYGFAAWIGLGHSDSSITALVLAGAILPVTTWIAYRAIVRPPRRVTGG